MTKGNHRPIRTCLGCGERDQQSNMLRFAAVGDGMLKLSRVGLGRGGYVHNREKCFEAFAKRKSVYRAFRAEVSKTTRESLLREIKARAHGVSNG